MARIINQNNEVIATKDEKGVKKATVSKTTFIVGTALAIAAIAIIIVVILFLTKKDKEDKTKTKTPLLQYIDNYNGNAKVNPKIRLLEKGDISYEISHFTGECYILIYDVDWMENNDSSSALYDSYDRLDSYLTGKPRINGEEFKGESLLSAIENCGQDIKFFVVDLNSIKKTDSELEKNPEYFKSHNGVSFQSLQSPMLFHYKDSEYYSSMSDTDLLIADGNTKSGSWKVIINKEVQYLNNITTSTDTE